MRTLQIYQGGASCSGTIPVNDECQIRIFWQFRSMLRDFRTVGRTKILNRFHENYDIDEGQPYLNLSDTHLVIVLQQILSPYLIVQCCFLIEATAQQKQDVDMLLA